MENFIIMLIIGGLSGWLGSLILNTNLGLIGNILLGLIGGIVGGWLLMQLQISIFNGLVGSIITGAIGAILLLLIYNLIAKK
jgi:uncharacterized membrane protein YeaQ/YmgE (transglycosylase-associated protein family)